MVEVMHRVSGRKVRIPLAGPANRQGRIAASNALGQDLRYGGALGTSVVKVFDATAAMTGLSERAAREAGFQAGVAVVYKDHHAGYFPGARELVLKLVYDRPTARLLGAQAFGHAGVEKRIDVLAVALQSRMTLHELAEIDLAYAPPYSSANDPVNVAAFVGQNDLRGSARSSRRRSSRQGSPAMRRPSSSMCERMRSGPPATCAARSTSRSTTCGRAGRPCPDDRRIAVHCKSGFRAHLALRILRERGFQDVVNVTGGWLAMQAAGGFDVERAERRPVGDSRCAGTTATLGVEVREASGPRVTVPPGATSPGERRAANVPTHDGWMVARAQARLR